jgi:mono/diheme cytochrome c family protein
MKNTTKANRRATRTAFVAAILGFAVTALAAAALTAAPPQDGDSGPAAASPAEHRALLDQYCVACHNQRARTADLAFDTMDLAHVGDEAEIWEEAVRKLRAGMMPPPGARRPAPAAVESFVSWLETSLDRAAADSPTLGRVALHRLNRAEYANAVEDLLGLRVDASTLLPVDDVADGFENIANVLKVSPSFLDQYISAARVVSSQAIGNPSARAVGVTYTAPPGTDQGRHVEGLPLGTRGGMLIEHLFPADGEYVFDIGNLATAGYVQGLEYRHRVIVTIDGVRVFENELGGEPDLRNVDQNQAPAVEAINDRFKNIRLNVEAGPHEVGVTFVSRGFGESDVLLQPFDPGGGMDRIPGVRSLQITGPFDTAGVSDTPSRRRIFTCRPSDQAAEDEELACATEILSGIARRAFRRPVTEADMVAPLAFFRDARRTEDFDAGIQSALMLILASPKFLYRTEVLPESADGIAVGDIYPISDLELASRLSFFLWSQGPDEALLDLAVQERLREPAVLDAQVERMLADPRSSALVSNFAFQWLNLGAIGDFDPDPIVFPGFDGRLKVAFHRELELFVQSIIDEDRSVVDLLTADHTFLNERLALHYGIPNVRGTRFRRVTLTDPNRWGLLGKGGVLMITSYPNRTTPVLRGAWILERLMGTPPPTPPPDVEAFPETVAGERALTVRERLEVHRANPACTSCHAVIDPLGFALENFDGVGQWREVDSYAGTRIDASGRLVDGTVVEGPGDLRRALAGSPDLFVRAMTEKLLMYALGRPVEYYDMPVVRHIVRSAAADDYRLSAIVSGIVRSQPFLMKQLTEGDRGPDGAVANEVR